MSAEKVIQVPCPACGYILDFHPWIGTSPSDEICLCCDIQFGYQDCFPDDEAARNKVYVEWREEWIKQGMPWFRGREDPPEGWDPKEQLKNIGVVLK